VRHGRRISVNLADEMVDIPGYGQARQLTLHERGTPVLQVLTSDTNATGAALLAWLRGRWGLENVFKYAAAHNGIDAIASYAMDIVADDRKVANPARRAARGDVAAAEATLAAAERRAGRRGRRLGRRGGPGGRDHGGRGVLRGLRGAGPAARPAADLGAGSAVRRPPGHAGVGEAGLAVSGGRVPEADLDRDGRGDRGADEPE